MEITGEQKQFGYVLVVEDDPLFVDWISRCCQKLNLSFETTSEPAEAERLLREKTYHAALVDLYYFDKTRPQGVAVAKTANQMGVPVVAMTANLSSDAAKQVTNAGASYILEKPFQADELKSALNTAWAEPRGLSGISERTFDHYGLTKKEREVVRLVMKGMNSEEIGRILEISIKTVKSHLTNVFSKCSVRSRSELVSLIIPF